MSSFWLKWAWSIWSLCERTRPPLPDLGMLNHQRNLRRRFQISLKRMWRSCTVQSKFSWWQSKFLGLSRLRWPGTATRLWKILPVDGQRQTWLGHRVRQIWSSKMVKTGLTSRDQTSLGWGSTRRYCRPSTCSNQASHLGLRPQAQWGSRDPTWMPCVTGLLWRRIGSPRRGPQTTPWVPREWRLPEETVQVLCKRGDWVLCTQAYRFSSSGRRRAPHEEPQEVHGWWLWKGGRRRGKAESSDQEAVGADAHGFQEQPSYVFVGLPTVSTVRFVQEWPWWLVWLVLWTRDCWTKATSLWDYPSLGRAECMAPDLSVDGGWGHPQEFLEADEGESAFLDPWGLRTYHVPTTPFPREPKGKGKGKGKGKTKSVKGVYQDHLKPSPSGQKGGGKFEKGQSKGGRPSGWPTNWALQSPTGVPYCRDFHLKHSCQGNCNRSHACPVKVNGWTCNGDHSPDKCTNRG